MYEFDQNMTAKIEGQKSGSWIRGLDSIRFVLAFVVFLSHLGNPFHEYGMHSSHLAVKAFAIGWGLLFSGVGAVMAFFIISGFVIHYPNREKYPETRSFLVRRWLRIGLPLLVISSIARGFHIFSVIPIWSLYCELIYYTLYPVLIRIKMSWVNKFRLSFILACLMVICLAPNDWKSLVSQKNISYSGAYWQLGDLLTWIIGLPCWLLGVILAQNIDSYQKNISTFRIYLLRFLVLMTGIALDILKFHFFFGYFFSMNLFALVLFFWIKFEILYFKKWQPVKSLEYLGKFSYSLYLCHNVFVFFIGIFLPLTAYTYIPIIAFTLLLSYFFYICVEKPSHLLSRKLGKLARNQRPAIE
ncbi:MAG TPA: acyltransferase [Puia sp.]|jgi:peptidoglycan/LPS O-acetylase OafA/YrhL